LFVVPSSFDPALPDSPAAALGIIVLRAFLFIIRMPAVDVISLGSSIQVE
jgi:hypothetical protein